MRKKEMMTCGEKEIWSAKDGEVLMASGNRNAGKLMATLIKEVKFSPPQWTPLWSDKKLAYTFMKKGKVLEGKLLLVMKQQLRHTLVRVTKEEEWRPNLKWETPRLHWNKMMVMLKSS